MTQRPGGLTSLAGAQGGGPAVYAPPDTAAFLSVRDARPFLDMAVTAIEGFEAPGTALVSILMVQLRQSLAGPVSLAVMKEGDEINGLLRVSITKTPEALDTMIESSARGIAGNAEVVFTPGAVRRLQVKDSPIEVFWGYDRDVLYVSDVRERLLQAVPGRDDGSSTPEDATRSTLFQQPCYTRLGPWVDWNGSLTAYVDLQRLVWDEWPDPDDQQAFTLTPDSLLPYLVGKLRDQLQAVGVSLEMNGESTTARLALLTTGKRDGITAFLDHPNGPVRGLDRIPDTCGFVASSIGTVGRLDVLARLMSQVDDEIAEEFRTELAEFNRELGVDLEKDLLEAIGSYTLGVETSTLKDMQVYEAIHLTEPARVQRSIEALCRYNETPLTTFEHEQMTVHVIPAGVPLHYTIEGDTAYLGLSTEALATMMALPGKSRSVAASPGFKALSERLPEEVVAMWAGDVRWLFEVVARALPSVGDRDVRRMLSSPAFRYVASEIRKIEPGYNLGMTLRNEPDAFVVHMESLALNPLQLLRGIAGRLGPLDGR